MKKRKVAILVPVGSSSFNRGIMKSVKPVLPKDFRVDIFNLDQDSARDCIEGRIDLQTNGYPVVLRAKELEAEGYEGIWLSDFDMCGVEAAREVIDIPIVGGFPPSAFTALSLSRRFSIVTILDSTTAMQAEHVHAYGLQGGFASIRSIDCPAGNLKTEEVCLRVYEAARLAIRQDGAQSILLGCTGFTGTAGKVSKMLSIDMGRYIPVIDPNQAGFGLLISLVRMSVRPSRLTYGKRLPAQISAIK